jgi:hypothetical protein
MSDLYIAQGSKIAARMLGAETLIMSPEDSTIFSLDETGSLIWQAADGRTPLQQIVNEKICSAYEVEPQQALADAEDFVQSLAAHGILLVSSEPFEGVAP